MKILGLFTTIILLQLAAVAETPLPEHAKVLGRYIGNWELTFSNAPNSPVVEKYEWVLNGGFIRKSAYPSSNSGAMTMLNMQMLQFDKAKGRYVQWTFMSGGGFLQAEGIWDSSSKTLTWTGRDVNTTTVIKTTVVDADNDTVTVVVTDNSGKIIQERNGKRTRRN